MREKWCALALFTFSSLAAADSALTHQVGDRYLNWIACPQAFVRGCSVAYVHGGPGKPNSDIFLRIPGWSGIPTHWHSSAQRMIVLSGELELGHDGSETNTYTPGSYLYTPRRNAHGGHCRSEEDCVVFIALEQPLDVFTTDPD